MTDAHRRDLGENALVIGVYPGPIDTDMSKDLDMEKFMSASVADELLDALNEGKEHVFRDPVSKKLINEFLEETNATLKQDI